MKPARLIVVPGNPGAKSKKQRNTRVFLPSGHEIVGVDYLSAQAGHHVFHGDLYAPVVKDGQLLKVTMEFHQVEVSIQLQAPKKQ